MPDNSAILEGEQSIDFPIFPGSAPDRPYSITYHSYGPCITPHGFWTPACVEALQRHQVKGVNLNLWTGWRHEPLDFVRSLAGISALHIFTGAKEDLTPLEALRKTLARLVLQCRVSELFDVSAFPHLRHLWCYGSPKLQGIQENPSLETLGIYGGPKFRSFDHFRKLRKLSSLSLTKGGVQELGFTYRRPEMRELEILHCYKFASLECLEAVPNLKRLEIVSAKKVPSIDAVAQLKELEWLTLDGCGTYKSLDPILELKNLHYLSLTGSTTFREADLKRLLDMPNLKVLIIESRRHYDTPLLYEVCKELRRRETAVHGTGWQDKLRRAWAG